MSVVRARIQTVEEITSWSGVPLRISGRSKRFIKSGAGCSARTGWVGIGKGNLACSAINTAAKATADLAQQIRHQIGAVLRWRNSAGVKLLGDRWRTAPNHSRPSSCIAEADIDAEDYYPERDPQKGH